MAKKFFLIALWILSSVSIVFSQSIQKIKAKKYPAEISVSTWVQLDVSPDGTNAKISPRPNGKGFDAAYQASSNKWGEMRISFVPQGDAEATVIFRAGTASDENGKAVYENVYFDDVKIGGNLAENGDFQKGFERWILSEKNPQLVDVPNPKDDGDKCAKVALSRTVSMKIKLKKGEKIDLSAKTLCDDGWQDSTVADLREIANINPEIENAGVKIGKLENLKTPKTPRLYGGMKFRLLNPQKNNGMSAVATSALNNSVVLDLSKKPPQGKYIYLLHTAGYDARKNFARISVKFMDGREKVLNVSEGVDVGMADAPAKACDNALPVFINDKKNKTGVLYLSRFDVVGGDQPGKIESIKFESKKDWIIAGVTISSREVNTTENYVFDPKIWKPLDIDTLEVTDGSALDLSAEVEKGAPAGKFGKSIIGKNGGFAFEQNPDAEIRYKSANFFGLICQFGSSIKTHEEIDKYVKLLKKQGFNAIRWRFVMNKSEFAAPYELKPLHRDLYDYFLYALAREGLYSFFYLCSHDTGDPSFTWNDRFTVKVKMMLGDEQTREAWRKLAKMQLEHVNPYTKKAWKDDNSIAALEYWNEFELGVVVYPAITQEGRDLIRKKFAAYLAKRFKNPREFLSYCEKIGKPWKVEGAFETFEEVDVSPYPNRAGNPVFARFIIEAMEDMQAFCEKVVREEIGMKVPTHQNNCIKNVYWTYLSSEGGSYTAVNTYHMHPSSYSLGANVPDKSSIENQGAYWRNTVVKKVAGMPIAVTEYQHCYFNRFMHEAGVLFPAYSAFQGYNALVAFDSPVAIKPGKLSFFNIGVNPVFRVNDFLTYFMFYRGDVKKSPHRIDVVFDKNYMDNSPNVGLALNDEQSKISLMTGFAVSFPDGRKLDEVKAVKLQPADMVFAPVGASAIEADLNFANIGKSVGADFDSSKIVTTLKEKGILPQDNISDPQKGVFQTDTGEITMFAKERILQVVTPKTEAVVMNASDKSRKLGALTVNSTTVDGVVAVVSIDDKPIAESSRMVLAISTDNVPTNVGLSSTRLKINAWGKAPILIQTGKFSLELKVSEKREFEVWQLKMSGERTVKIPAVQEGGLLKLEIDTSKNVAMYFEIVAR
jgi:hypothetical protein